MNLEGVRRDPQCPKQTGGIREDAGVEVMDLCREVGEVKLTLVDIQSDKSECIPLDLTIHPDICSLHEAHVDVE
jgi:hypothetical protein